jgi:hypothetical protein
MSGCSLAEWRDNLESPSPGFFSGPYTAINIALTRIRGHLLIREMMRKKMNRKFLVTTFVALFGLVGIQSAALAVNGQSDYDFAAMEAAAPKGANVSTCLDRDDTNEETNAEYYNAGWEFAALALVAANAGDVAGTRQLATSSMLQFKCMVNTTFGSMMQRITSPIRKAELYAKKAVRDEKKGNTEAAAAKIAKAAIQLAEAIKRAEGVDIENSVQGMCFSCLVGGERKKAGVKE